LQVGSDVRLSGVKVGLISDITVDPSTFMAQVKFSLRDEIKLPVDSSAEIVSDGLLGGKYLALVPGGDEETLSSGSEIAYTQASVSLEAMIGQLIFSKKDEGKEDKASAKKAKPLTSTSTPTP
jgi:phospholipid/cholesterol/gamma-HCH transport system substrate-binding protein